MRRALLAVLLVFVAFICCEAQTMQVSGVVQDPTGAVVTAAQVTITNVDTSATRSGETGADGSYVITNLPVGPYRLEVTKGGFVKYVQTGIVLQVGINPQVNVTLKIGALSEVVEVSANATMMDTVSTAVGEVIDPQRVIDLPLNGRNVTQLITLSGAAVANSGTGLVNNLNYPTVAAFAISGGQGNSTNYFLDGGIHLDSRTNVGLPLPFPDALQEFRVETSSLPANYGSRPGGAVNAVTASGTNTVHGDAFWFVRNGAMNARNFFAAQRDSLKRNQFGGVLGGAIKKDRLFYFVGFQGTTERTAPGTSVAYVPTAAVLQGNFQTILSTPCQTKAVTLTAASGAVNNIVPQSLLNPVALKFASLLPVASDPCGKIFYGVPTKDNEYQEVARLDWQRVPQKDSIFFRTFITDYALDAIYDKTNVLTAAANSGLKDRVSTLDLGDTYLVNSSTVSSFRLTYARSAVRRVGADGVPTMTDLGSNVYSPVKNYIGQIQASGYFAMNLPSGAIPAYVVSNIYGLSEELGMTHGAHQMTIGFNWTNTRLGGLGMFQMNPRMLFTGQITGNSLAEFMTGDLDTFLQGNGQIANDHQNSPSLYFQDNWKVAPRLQVNLGVRWDPFVPQHQMTNYASTFNLADFYAGKVSQVYVNAPPGLKFPGDPGYPGSSDTFPKYADFAPRFGVVFQPRANGTETIRAGYGIFYDSNYLWMTSHIPLNAPWGTTLTLTAPSGGLSNPWLGYPGGNPFPTASNPSSSVAFPLAGTYVFEPDHVKPTYVQQWNVAFQKQLGANLLLSATYLGNKTTHQWLARELNPAVYSPGATTATTQARRLLVLTSPAGKYFGSTAMVDDGGDASYNGLLLSANKRFSHNFSAMANYTWSHCLDQGEANQDIANAYQNPSNRKAEWASCASDVRGLFNLSLIAQSPKLGSTWMQRVTGNWQLSGIFNYRTGTVVNVTDGTDISLTGVSADRPNTVASASIANPTIAKWFNTSAFQPQATGTFGNTGKNVLRGPSSWNLDTSLARSLQLRERLKMNFRFEAFNVLNHARFGNPTSALNAAAFGQITSAMDPRILQLALKFQF